MALIALAQKATYLTFKLSSHYTGITKLALVFQAVL